jgi:hypothetical protein
MLDDRKLEQKKRSEPAGITYTNMQAARALMIAMPSACSKNKKPDSHGYQVIRVSLQGFKPRLF